MRREYKGVENICESEKEGMYYCNERKGVFFEEGYVVYIYVLSVYMLRGLHTYWI